MSLLQPKAGSGLNTIAFDLDGTLAEPTWPRPEIGKPIQKAVDLAIDYFTKGFEIIIFTARPQSHFDIIVKWLGDNGLDFIYDVICGKPRYALFIDDRAATFPEAFAEPEIEPGPEKMYIMTRAWGGGEAARLNNVHGKPHLWKESCEMPPACEEIGTV